MRSEGYSFRPSVCYHVFCHYAQQGGQEAIPTDSVPHWLHFKKGDFRKSTAFKSYGVKTSQYAIALMSMAYLDQILPVSSTVEAVEVTRKASTWSWFAKNTTYRRGGSRGGGGGSGCSSTPLSFQNLLLLLILSTYSLNSDITS